MHVSGPSKPIVMIGSSDIWTIFNELKLKVEELTKWVTGKVMKTSGQRVRCKFEEEGFI